VFLGYTTKTVISFSKLGQYGRLGNQLFQYAFLRSQAKRLGVPFYCPAWIGDTIFALDDSSIKGESFTPSSHYLEDPGQHGFSEDAITIKDDTDVEGYFQTEKFFNREDVLRWFSFNEPLFEEVRQKYSAVNFDSATALHVRLGDYLIPSLMFYIPTSSYFKRAVAELDPKGQILVFSENPSLARKYLGELSKRCLFVEGNKDYEDFYIMTQCKDIVISSSSFSWWAAYLNRHNDKRVIMPASWFIPTCPVVNNDIFVDGWKRLKAHRVIRDNYYFRYFLVNFRRFLGR
jgi:hypothetical protein